MKHEHAPLSKLRAWRQAQAELIRLQLQLAEILEQCAATRGEPPRHLIIEVEKKREQLDALFEATLNALDAQSSVRTGHTDFGSMG
jgi:hypothetical protein